MKEEETVLGSNYTKGVVTAAHYIHPVPGAEADDETWCSGRGPGGGYDFDVKRVRRVRPTPSRDSVDADSTVEPRFLARARDSSDAPPPPQVQGRDHGDTHPPPAHPTRRTRSQAQRSG